MPHPLHSATVAAMGAVPRAGGVAAAAATAAAAAAATTAVAAAAAKGAIRMGRTQGVPNH